MGESTAAEATWDVHWNVGDEDLNSTSTKGDCCIHNSELRAAQGVSREQQIDLKMKLFWFVTRMGMTVQCTVGAVCGTGGADGAGGNNCGGKPRAKPAGPPLERAKITERKKMGQTSPPTDSRGVPPVVAATAPRAVSESLFNLDPLPF